ncbi:MAG: putative DNA binding domain-containing protein [Fibrobacteria bacterium]|nr:putative DNA binding domain-containing protein [Fibrobacteria bacterium]
MDIEKLLKQEESNKLEFKEIFPKKEKLASILCSFANSIGGDLIIGVEDGTKRPIGLPENKILELEEKISSISAVNIYPTIFPIIKIIRYKDVLLLVVHLDMGYQKPYRIVTGSNAKKTFVRVGSSTRVADPATVKFMELKSSGLSWDTLPCKDCSINDLNQEHIQEFFELRQQSRKLPMPAISGTAWLRKMKYAVEIGGKLIPTMGAVLLFHDSPQDIFPQVGLEMARFKGDSPRDFIDKQTAKGPIWKMVEQGQSFLLKHLPVSAVRTKGARIEKCIYPEIAFKEFLINAICHRSYEPGTGTIKLAIFDNIIEITNSGTLPDGLEMTDLGTGVSVLRNPLIARALNEIGMIEGWGTGIQIAQQEISKQKLPPADILMKGFFIQISSKWRWHDNLTVNEKKVLQEIASSGTITSTTVSNLLGMTNRGARKLLSSLIKKEYIYKQGTTKSSAYRLVNDMNIF